MRAFGNPLITPVDGMVKQVNPFSGTQAWIVPSRDDWPLRIKHTDPQPPGEKDFESRDSLGWNSLLQIPPGKARAVLDESVFGGRSAAIGVLLDQLFNITTEPHRVPSLFEIVSYDCWSENYGFEPDRETQQRMEAYLDDLRGHEHVPNIIRMHYHAVGCSEEEISALSDEELLCHTPGYFAGGYDVVVIRRHFVDGAIYNNQLASSGTLGIAKHHAPIASTVESIVGLCRRNRYVRYVAAFQN